MNDSIDLSQYRNHMACVHFTNLGHKYINEVACWGFCSSADATAIVIEAPHILHDNACIIKYNRYIMSPSNVDYIELYHQFTLDEMYAELLGE